MTACFFSDHIKSKTKVISWLIILIQFTTKCVLADPGILVGGMMCLRFEKFVFQNGRVETLGGTPGSANEIDILWTFVMEMDYLFPPDSLT